MSFKERELRSTTKSRIPRPLRFVSPLAISLAVACSSGGEAGNKDFTLDNVPASPTPIPEATPVPSPTPTVTPEATVPVLSPTPETTPISSPTSRPEPTATPEAVKLTPEQRMLSYSQEVIKPEFMPKELSDITVEPDGENKDQNIYITSGQTEQGIRVVFAYLESVKSNRFSKDGLPLDITTSFYYQGDFNPSPENIQGILEKHFDDEQRDQQPTFDNFTTPITLPSGEIPASVWETVWDNDDGTKESRWVLRYETTDSVGNKVTRFVVSATKIFEDNPLFDKNTSHERE